MKYLIEITPDGTVNKRPYPDSFELTLDILQEYVGGYIETVRLKDAPNNNLIMIIDEEGKLNNKPVNEIASDIEYIRYDDYIAGKAYIAVTNGEDIAAMSMDDADNVIDWIG